MNASLSNLHLEILEATLELSGLHSFSTMERSIFCAIFITTLGVLAHSTWITFCTVKFKNITALDAIICGLLTARLCLYSLLLTFFYLPRFSPVPLPLLEWSEVWLQRYCKVIILLGGYLISLQICGMCGVTLLRCKIVMASFSAPSPIQGSLWSDTKLLVVVFFVVLPSYLVSLILVHPGTGSAMEVQNICFDKSYRFMQVEVEYEGDRPVNLDIHLKLMGLLILFACTVVEAACYCRICFLLYQHDNLPDLRDMLGSAVIRKRNRRNAMSLLAQMMSFLVHLAFILLKGISLYSTNMDEHYRMYFIILTPLNLLIQATLEVAFTPSIKSPFKAALEAMILKCLPAATPKRNANS